MAKYGWNPRFTELPHPLVKSKPHGPATDLATQLTELHASLRAELKYAQIRQAEYADGSRVPALKYELGDKVWLSSKHFRTQRSYRKLDHNFLGLYKILKPVGTHAYHLQLPRTIKRHPVVHVSKLEPPSKDPLPGQQTPPPPPVVVEGEEE